MSLHSLWYNNLDHVGTLKYINLLLYKDIHLQRVKYIINEQSMNINVFLLFCSFVFLQIEREREGGYIKLGIRRNGPKVYLSFFFDGVLWRIFLLLRANRLYLIFNTGLKKMASSCLAEFLRLLLPGVLGFGSDSYEPCPTTNFSFLFPPTGRSPYFRFRVPANRLASTFFLLVSGGPSEVAKYQHLLVSPWPTFFLNGHSLTACYC